MHELRTLSSELPVKEQERARNLSHMLRSELTSLRQGPSSLAQRLKKATPGTYSKNSQKHFGSVVLDQQRRSAKTQNPTSLHRLLCWCTLIKQRIRAEGTGKSFTEAVTRTLGPTLLLRQTINLSLRRQPPCRVALRHAIPTAGADQFQASGATHTQRYAHEPPRDHERTSHGRWATAGRGRGHRRR